VCRSHCRWYNGYRSYHWTQGSRVQTRSRAIDFEGDKNQQHNFLRGGSRPSATCCKILRHVKIPAEYDRSTSSAKFQDISRQPPASLLGVCDGICQTALVDESGKIRTEMGTHNEKNKSTIHGTLCTIPRRNSNQ
jgi:hypothetical protein